MTHWKLEPIIHILKDCGGEDVSDAFKLIAAWREAAVVHLDLLKAILSFKTQKNSSDTLMQRAAPLQKDLEDRPRAVACLNLGEFRCDAQVNLLWS